MSGLVYIFVNDSYPENEIKAFSDREVAMRYAVDFVRSAWPVDAPAWVESDDDLLQWANEDLGANINVLPVMVDALPLGVE